MAKTSKGNTASVALPLKARRRSDTEALWTRIQGRSGVYQVQRAAEASHNVDLRTTQPICDCDTYRERAQRRAGKGAACPHIAALRDCGFLAA